jgi:hypothetical protein
VGCPVAPLLGGRDVVAEQAGCGYGVCQGRPGPGGVEIPRLGDWANGRVNIGRPVEPRMSMRHWVGSHVGCGRWCGVRGVVALLYPVVLAFPWLVYFVTYLRVAAGGFVLELPRLVYLVLLAFELLTLDYPVFAVFEPSVLVLGFPGCVSLVSALLYPLLLSYLHLSFSHSFMLLCSPFLDLFSSHSQLLVALLFDCRG